MVTFAWLWVSQNEQTWSSRGLEPGYAFEINPQMSNTSQTTAMCSVQCDTLSINVVFLASWAFALHRCSWYFLHDIRISEGADHNSRTSINMICLTLFHHLGWAEARPCSAAVPAAVPLSLKLTSPADICSHWVYLDFKDQDSHKKKATKQNERNDETRESTDLERDVSRVHVTIKHDKYNKNKSNEQNQLYQNCLK